MNVLLFAMIKWKNTKRERNYLNLRRTRGEDTFAA